ncbi:MAG: HIT family protein [Candidatus Latescibacterota bacterium]
MAQDCVFCRIVQGTVPASVVWRDEQTLAFVDLRQLNPGHTLVIPCQHLHDVRDLDPATGAALMATLSRVTRAVGAAFPTEGISLWHSIGPAAFQEVPHLHFHVQPRQSGDKMLRVYPTPPVRPDAATLEAYAARIRQHL